MSLLEIPESELTSSGRPFAEALASSSSADVLGSGSNGPVRTAVWRRGGRETVVAVKTLLLDAGAADMERGKREAAVMAHLSHPHVVRLHGICTSAAPRALHIVMELATGGSLDTLVKPGGRLHSSGPLPLTSPARLAEVARLGSQAALGLLHAHAKGIAHCDVKLAHFLLSESGHLLLTGFGIAFRVSQSGQAPAAPVGELPGQHAQLGTFGYLAPENFQEGPHLGQPPCDVYSLGFALLELAQGEPVPSPRLVEAIAALPPPGSAALAALGIPCVGSGARPGLPEWLHPGLASLISSCWAADPRERPLLEDVARALLGIAASAEREERRGSSSGEGPSGAPPAMTREGLLAYLHDLAGAYSKLSDNNSVESAQLKSQEGAATVMAAQVKAQVEAFTKALQSKHRVDESKVLAATQVHSEDPEVQQLTLELQRLALGSEHVDGPERESTASPGELTVDVFVAKLKRYNEVFLKRYQAMFAGAREEFDEGGSMEEKMAYVEMLQKEDQEEVLAQTEEALGMSEGAFKAALQQFSTEASVQELMQAYATAMQALLEEYLKN